MKRFITKQLMVGILGASSLSPLATPLFAETPSDSTALLAAELKKMQKQMQALQNKLDALEAKEKKEAKLQAVKEETLREPKEAEAKRIDQAIARAVEAKLTDKAVVKAVQVKLTDQAVTKAVEAKLAEKDKNTPKGYTALMDTNTYIKLGGYLRTDVIYNPGVVTGDVVNAPALPIPYSPSLVTAPVDAANASKTGTVRFSGRPSRLTSSTLTKTAGGEVTTYAELDFLGGIVTSNSYIPRLRHLYGTYGNWLVGQTWTTFLDLEASGAYTLDMGGPGTSAWVRNPQIAYTFHPYENFDITTAVELPVTDYTDSNGVARENHPLLGSNPAPGALTAGDGTPNFPDLHLKLRYAFTKGEEKLGHIALRGFIRQLRFRSNNLAAVSSLGYGIGLSGRLFVHGQSNVFADVHGGNGIGRYINHFTGGSASYSGAPVAAGAVGGGFGALPGTLNVQPAYGILVGLEHYWTEDWRTYIVYDMSKLQLAPATFYNQTVYGTAGVAGIAPYPQNAVGLNNAFQEFFANLVYSPVDAQKSYEVGLEYTFLQRQTVNAGQGQGHRILLGVSWKF